jgi:hypothetical protein
MGQAQQRKSRLTRMLAEQPWCIYCGGETPGSSVDHMPPIAVCDDRLRPVGMEFIACKECHDGTRKTDQVAGLFCRVYPNSTSPTARQEIAKIFAGLRNNQPEVFNELRPTRRQLQFVRSATGVMADGGGAFNVGDNTNERIMQFGARAALALHYHLTGNIVPKTGLVWVVWHTNEQLIMGDFPEAFAAYLPPHQTLRAGHNTLEGQFDFSSRITDDNRMSAHMMTFRLSFAIQAAVALDAADFAASRAKKPELFFEPGFLRTIQR